MILFPDAEVEIHSEPEAQRIEISFAALDGRGALAAQIPDFEGVGLAHRELCFAIDHFYGNPRPATPMHDLLGECKEHTVLLAHNPLFFSAYAEWGAALTLSGHIHGGVVRLPGIGGLLSPARRFMPRYAKSMSFICGQFGRWNLTER